VVDRDLILAKIATVDRCLRRIAEVRGERRASLTPVDVEDIVLLNLQRAVQAAIDLAAHVVASEGYGVPDSIAACFSILEGQNLLEPELASRLRRMGGFRNIAVHNYQALDLKIVEAIVTRHLDDLRAFCSRITGQFLPPSTT
jgi:uncharacterized protein YutE (UPF0331/DUF86 family)